MIMIFESSSESRHPAPGPLLVLEASELPETQARRHPGP